MSSDAYQKAGVSLDAGYESVERIKKHIKRTEQKGVMGGIGNFGGMFDLSIFNYKNPVLVSGTDGVGTKLKLAFMMDKHDTIGQDVVAMCVNDIIAQGAKPLFFLDYIACDQNKPEKIEQIVKGISDACVESECALVGGETAEMPDMYAADEYDLAGFTVGIVEKDKIITGEKTKSGDVLIGLSSSGVHSNGFSLVRKIVLKDSKIKLDTYYEELGKTIGEELLTPTKLYVKPVLKVLENIDVHGIAHITGGGFYENIPRCLNKGLGVEVNKENLEILPIFNILQELAGLSDNEMFNVFNMGCGMVLVVDEKDVNTTLDTLKNNNQNAYVIGKVIDKEGVYFNE